MKNTLAVLVLLSVVPICALAQEDPTTTHGSKNGRHWNAMTDRDRFNYMQGYLDAIRVVSEVEPVRRGGFVESSLPTRHTYGDLRDQIDMFYADPANRPIPIVLISFIAVQRLDGVGEEYVNKKLREWRELASKP